MFYLWPRCWVTGQPGPPHIVRVHLADEWCFPGETYSWSIVAQVLLLYQVIASQCSVSEFVRRRRRGSRQPHSLISISINATDDQKQKKPCLFYCGWLLLIANIILNNKCEPKFIRGDRRTNERAFLSSRWAKQNNRPTNHKNVITITWITCPVCSEVEERWTLQQPL